MEDEVDNWAGWDSQNIKEYELEELKEIVMLARLQELLEKLAIKYRECVASNENWNLKLEMVLSISILCLLICLDSRVSRRIRPN
jgi:hypothetical protein